ncbi:MAG: hypothetical protein AAGK78_17765, partial [Planctomycetota bacterium]
FRRRLSRRKSLDTVAEEKIQVGRSVRVHRPGVQRGRRHRGVEQITEFELPVLVQLDVEEPGIFAGRDVADCAGAGDRNVVGAKRGLSLSLRHYKKGGCCCGQQRHRAVNRQVHVSPEVKVEQNRSTENGGSEVKADAAGTARKIEFARRIAGQNARFYLDFW